MLKKKLAEILEENHKPEEETPRRIQTQAAQPPATSEDWGELLIRLLASAPEDVAQKLITCIDREVIAKALERRNDPYLKVALLLLTKND